MGGELDPIQTGASSEARDTSSQGTTDVSDATIEKLRAIGTEMARLSQTGVESTRNLAEAALAERARAEQSAAEVE